MDLVLQQSLCMAAALAVEAPELSDHLYPRWVRMLIIVGGSALLWVLIGMLGSLAIA